MMRTSTFRTVSNLLALLLVAFFISAPPALAQEATLSGTVTDSTGGVLPGVTITAVHADSGNTFVAVTDGMGAFRLPLRTGAYRITAELQGFAPQTRTLELLVGQQGTVNLQLAPSALQETVTVSGAAPLIDVTSSTVSGNIDPRQMQELPINGRAWQDLALLAPGNRSNAITDSPVDRTGGTYQINIDGQQVTQLITQSGAFGNPKFSRDAIAEFELVTNRFDATQGRSMGVQVNAVTKSGTNSFAGTFASYFRDDKFNAADHVVDRVLPYSDQQYSLTFGGPLRKDRMHFFANLEYEREPQTQTFTTPFAAFNQDQKSKRREHTGGARVDVQFSPKTRLSVRGNTWQNYFPFGTGGAGAAASTTTTPAAAIKTTRWTNEVLGTLTRVLGNRGVNELQVGFATYNWDLASVVQVTYPAGLVLPSGAPTSAGGPRVTLRGGLTIGPGHQFTPQGFRQRTLSFRDNLSYSYTARGRHDVKVGGEYLHYPTTQYFCNNCFGQLDANTAPIPANVDSLFPDLFNADTWRLGPLSPIAIRWRQSFGNFNLDTPRYVTAGWLQDDWAINSRLTLNLGVRYDLQLNVFTNDTEILPFLPSNRSNDVNNVAPRLGAVYSLNSRTVIRGGFGQFYGDVANTLSHYGKLYAQTIQAEVLYDGRPDFASNPFNGPTPTFAQAKALLCTPSAPTAAGCVRNSITNAVPSPGMEIPYSYQTSIGIQRQLGTTMSMTADYVYTGNRKEQITRNINLGYNPVTLANYPFADISRRPIPYWGAVAQSFNEGYSNSHGLEATFTRRFSGGWQVSGNYLLSGLWDIDAPVFKAVPLAPDMGGVYALAETDQRHRAVLNGIWQARGGLQLSGLYFFGSGQRFSTSWGSDLRDVGGVGGTNRLRPGGTIGPRNNLVGEPIHRIDMRVQQRLPTTTRLKVDGVLEIFNLLNNANFGSYVQQESNVRYGLPNLNTNVAYVPRELQLGLRIAF
jgi:carboxypeptidase family protein/TonB-dependent receptor-like protein